LLADCRARVLFISEALLRWSRTGRRIGRISKRHRPRVTTARHKKLSDEIAKRMIIPDRRDAADETAFCSTHPAPPRCPRVCDTCTQSRRDRGDLRKAGARIREDDVGLSAAKLFFAYVLGNALTFRCR